MHRFLKMYRVVCFVFIDCLLLECFQLLRQESLSKVFGVIFAFRHFTKLATVVDGTL